MEQVWAERAPLITLRHEDRRIARSPRRLPSPGDGTVPVASGAAPAEIGVKAAFRQTGYEHQDSYNSEAARFATFYSIVKIAQKADWHK